MDVAGVRVNCYRSPCPASANQVVSASGRAAGRLDECILFVANAPDCFGEFKRVGVSAEEFFPELSKPKTLRPYLSFRRSQDILIE